MQTRRQRIQRRLGDSGTSGLPLSGLVAAHHLYYPNILLQSETFASTSWTKTRSYIAANCATDPITGTVTVDKLVEDGTTAQTHRVAQTIAAMSGTATMVACLKAGGRTWASIDFPITNKRCYYNLSTGAVGTASAGFTGATVSLGDGWYDCYFTGTLASETAVYILPAEADADPTYSGLGHQGTAAAGGSTTTAVLAAGASASNDVYNTYGIIFSDAPTVEHTVTGYVGATLTATFTPARAGAPDATTYTVGPGIYVARAQLYPAATLPDYATTTDLQSLSGSYGTSTALIRGISTANTTNDFTVLGPGASMVTDDQATTGNLTGVTLAGPWTAMIVLKPAYAAGVDTALALYSGADDYAALNITAADAALATWTRASVADSATIAVTAASVQCLMLQANTTLTIKRMDTGQSATAAAKIPVGTAAMNIGSLVAGTQHADMTVYSVALWNRALSASEQDRAWKALKAYWSGKGVTVL